MNFKILSQTTKHVSRCLIDIIRKMSKTFKCNREFKDVPKIKHLEMYKIK